MKKRIVIEWESVIRRHTYLIETDENDEEIKSESLFYEEVEVIDSGEIKTIDLDKFVTTNEKYKQQINNF